MEDRAVQSFEDLEVWRAARSAALRQEVSRTGKPITGLIQSTQQRKQSHKHPYPNS